MPAACHLDDRIGQGTQVHGATPAALPKRQAGFEFSRVSKFTVSLAMAIWLCDVTFHGERVGKILRIRGGRYTVMACLNDDGKPTGLLSDHHGAVLTRRKGTSYDALVALIRAGDGFPANNGLGRY